MSNLTPTVQKPSRRKKAVLPLVVIIIAAALIAFVLWQSIDSDASESTPNTADQGAPEEGTPAEGPVEVPEGGAEPEAEDMSDIERRDPDDLLAVGPVDAPVAIVMFSDAQCPFCATWYDQTLPTMMDYVEDGDLRIEWRDVNVFGEASERAARASTRRLISLTFNRDHLAGTMGYAGEREISEIHCGSRCSVRGRLLDSTISLPPPPSPGPLRSADQS